MSRPSAHARGYDRRWQNARAAYLAQHPLCRYCQQVGRVTAATVVDHVIPHRGDRHLFWDATNWQPLCAECHNRLASVKDRGGRLPGCGADGLGIDGMW